MPGERIGTIESVNVGDVRRVAWGGRAVETGIWKAPVSGRVEVRGVNVDGDDQADRRVHGGPDKAVYAYAREDYEWWSGELGQVLAPGTFGDNLTTSGVDLASVIVGERWSVGSAILEVAQPRMPCFKLGMRMGDAVFVGRFEAAGRNGTYLRIIDAGDIGAGDPIDVVTRPPHGLTVAAIVLAYAEPTPQRLEQLASVGDVPESWRTWATRQLRRAGHR